MLTFCNESRETGKNYGLLMENVPLSLEHADKHLFVAHRASGNTFMSRQGFVQQKSSVNGLGN
jgi:hypothetical protein